LKEQILCNAQEGIKSLFSKINILPVPKPTLKVNNKPYMISFQMFSGDFHEGQAYGITIACVEHSFECERISQNVLKSKYSKCVQFKTFFVVRALKTLC